MTPPLPLVARFLLDAQDAFLRAIDHLPAPGRGGPLGRLNAAGWVVAHVADAHDQWLPVLIGGGERDPWATRWHDAQVQATVAHPLATPFDEACAAFLATAARAACSTPTTPASTITSASDALPDACWIA